jgi:hypothetical protein
VGIQPPTGFVHPVIDGELTNYFEWVGAGCVEVVSAGATMHEAAERQASITVIEFGFDLENLYLQVAGSVAMTEVVSHGLELSLNFLKPAGCRVTIGAERGTPQAKIVERAANGQASARSCPDIQVAVGRLLELRLPFRCLGVATHAAVSFIVALNRDGTEIERHPRHRPIELEVPDGQFPSRNWTA